jgi:hypothetical protein
MSHRLYTRAAGFWLFIFIAFLIAGEHVLCGLIGATVIVTCCVLFVRTVK